MRAKFSREPIGLGVGYTGEEAALIKLVLSRKMKGSVYGRRRFGDLEFYPVLKGNIDRFYERGTGNSLKYSLIHNYDYENRWLSRLTAEPPDLVHDIKQLRMAEAYLRVVEPGVFEQLDSSSPIDEVGAAFGSFLSDPSSVDDPYQAAVNAQGLLGLYSYTPSDSLGHRDGADRYVAFLVGSVSGYMLTIDIACEVGESEEIEEFYYGVCSPGYEFSPVMMRSSVLGGRVLGLVYSEQAFLGVSLREADKLRFDFMTPGHDFVPRDDADGEPDLMARIIGAVHGPKVTSNLYKVKNERIINELKKKVARIRYGDLP